MKNAKKPIIGSILLVILGSGWLLNNLQLIPGVNWIWILGLGVLGIITVAFGGINKISVIAGPFLMIASVLSMLRQTGRLEIDHEIPILMIVLGLLSLVSFASSIPEPAWFAQGRPKEQR